MDKKKDLASTFLETYYLLRRYNMLWYGKNFGGLDPRQGQGRILMALQRMRSATQRELGLILDIRPQSLGELLQKLESNGYIQRRRSEIDRRTLIVELTAKGELFQLRKPDYSELFIYLTAEEKRILKQSLEKISEQLEEMFKKENDDEFY
ncbi:MAG: MarR family transcriptional regulator [Selenomonadaceae bacterium]|nr:MarR family transcriptional regulator [Selenomonadaceae bacterium]MBQ6131760.1 MarR family transcriptional regulator [Selenomonadaceae bacterium]MBQ7493680.1 MarR family transcriptional regulator [Selenomonadaceae bacterium]